MNEKSKQNRMAIKPSWADLRETQTPYDKKEPAPDQIKHLSGDGQVIALDDRFLSITQKTLAECINNRKSLRKYSEQPLSFEELSYIIYETAYVKHISKSRVFRTIPTGGGLNGMETYVYIHNVTSIKKGLYHYMQDLHQLKLMDDSLEIEHKINEALYNQLRGAAMVIIMTTVPARSEYRYEFCAHKMLAMEAGHAGQNASLAAEVIDCGACCIAAYNQELLDNVLQVDGFDEFAMYAITIGKKI